jgi:hypothetical protein
LAVNEINAANRLHGDLRFLTIMASDSLKNRPKKNSAAREETVPIESQLADFQPEKRIARDCRHCGQRDFNRVLLLSYSANARQDGRIADIEVGEHLLWDQGYVDPLRIVQLHKKVP